jgi:hypothetical protein
MAEDKPLRSLRGGKGPRLYRDWEAMDNQYEGDAYVPSKRRFEDDDEDDSPPARGSDTYEEMSMVDGIDDPEETTPQPPPSPVRPQRVLADDESNPLPVIIPDIAPPVSEASKPKVTRVDRPKVQRARRRSEIIEEEEEAPPQKVAAPPPSRTRELQAKQATELRGNIQEISTKIDEAKENVKSTANSISDNIRKIADQITVNISDQAKKVGGIIAGLINRRLNKGPLPTSSVGGGEQDFDDAPMAAAPAARPAAAPAQAPQAPYNLLEKRVPDVVPVAYAPLYAQGVHFQTFDKQPLVANASQLSDQALNAYFIENAIADAHKCLKLVEKFPEPTDGPYAGISLVYLFENIRPDDVYYFLHYVQDKPKPFIDKQFKFSEAFASWVLKRSAQTRIADPFPQVPEVPYSPLYNDNIRFQTVTRKQLVIAAGKSPAEVDAMFIQNAMEDARQCVDFVSQFPPSKQGPYKDRPLRDIFKRIQPRDIHFFLHYVKSQPDVFRNRNLKFSEAFASWILKRSHETQL